MPTAAVTNCLTHVWPVLYKKGKTGAIQQWSIRVFPELRGTTTIGRMSTHYGQVGGAIQANDEWIIIGKNIGRSHETTALQQAINEAQARWEKQVKKGYVANIGDARSDKTELGGVLPMLAHSFDDHEKKLKYPCYVQPKLDGTRCIAVWNGTNVTLWTRTRKPIHSVPHIIRELEKKLRGNYNSLTLDGELYCHELKDDFERLISLIRQTNKPHLDHELIQYHVYDMINELDQQGRSGVLQLLINDGHPWSFVKMVKTMQVENREELDRAYDRFMNEGYEGAIARNRKAPYIHSRSHDLQKIKVFLDSEFPITGIEEGRGKLAGHAIFVCETKDGKKFNVKLDGPTERLKEIFEDQKSYIGKLLTVKYQNTTGYGLPRFPVGKVIRDYE